MQKDDREGMEDGHTKQTVCRFLVGDNSALTGNLWQKVKNEGERQTIYRGNNTKDKGMLRSE